MLKGNDNCYLAGTVSAGQIGNENYDGSSLSVNFADGSSKLVCFEEVVTGAFDFLIKEKHDWPGSTTGSPAERARRRRQEKERKKAITETLSGLAKKPAVKVNNPANPVQIKAQQNKFVRKLSDFKEDHGHCNVPSKYPGRLGQRSREATGYIDDSLKQKMEGLGFLRGKDVEDYGLSEALAGTSAAAEQDSADSTQCRPDQHNFLTARMSDPWEARFQELMEFKEEHGHCNVPSKHKGGLGMWARRNRWEARLRELKEFKDEHGHCNISRKYPGGLMYWVYRQRSKKASGGLDPIQVQKLEELGFRWGKDVKDCGLSEAALGTGVAAAQDDTDSTNQSSLLVEGDSKQESNTCSAEWESRLQELKKFKEEHDHCNVPSRHPGGLGDWANEQRSEKATGCLESGRAQKLKELGFQWLVPLLPPAPAWETLESNTLTRGPKRTTTWSEEDDAELRKRVRLHGVGKWKDLLDKSSILQERFADASGMFNVVYRMRVP